MSNLVLAKHNNQVESLTTDLVWENRVKNLSFFDLLLATHVPCETISKKILRGVDLSVRNLNFNDRRLLQPTIHKAKLPLRWQTDQYVLSVLAWQV